MIRRLLLGVFVVTAIALCASDAYPCSCAESSTRKAFRKAAAVFVGQVVEIKINDKAPRDSSSPFAVRLKVEKTWKGVKGPEITVSSAQGIIGCATRFAEGDRVLVYAYDKELEASICTRSRHIAGASEDMKKLNSFWFRLFALVFPF
jgi:hypothetical protein